MTVIPTWGMCSRTAPQNPEGSDTASTAPPCVSYRSPGWRRKGMEPIFLRCLHSEKLFLSPNKRLKLSHFSVIWLPPSFLVPPLSSVGCITILLCYCISALSYCRIVILLYYFISHITVPDSPSRLQAPPSSHMN